MSNIQHIGPSWHIDMVSFFKSSYIKASKQTYTSTESYIVCRCSILLDVKNDQTDSLFNYCNSTCLSPAAGPGEYHQAIRSEGFTLASTAEFPGRVWRTRTSETLKRKRNVPIALAIFPIRWTISLWVHTPLRNHFESCVLPIMAPANRAKNIQSDDMKKDSG